MRSPVRSPRADESSDTTSYYSFRIWRGAPGMYIMRLQNDTGANGVSRAREPGSSGFAKVSSGLEGHDHVMLALQNKDGSNWAGMQGKRACSRPAALIAKLPFICFLLILILSQPTLARLTSQQSDLLPLGPSLSSRAPNQSTPLLQCLQVSPPVLSPKTSCKSTLMVHTFAYSYGQPFVGQYNPPACDFNRVAINFTVTSAGRQYDRLALMFFNDTEIWRTSTAEPTQNGIIWTYSAYSEATVQLIC